LVKKRGSEVVVTGWFIVRHDTIFVGKIAVLVLIGDEVVIDLI
jgi:hypothetical protein